MLLNLNHEIHMAKHYTRYDLTISISIFPQNFLFNYFNANVRHKVMKSK